MIHLLPALAFPPLPTLRCPAGSAPKKVVKSKLSQLLAAEEGWLEGVANQAWRLFAEHPATAAAAKAMMDTMEADQLYK